MGGFEPPKHDANDLKSLSFDQTRKHYLIVRTILTSIIEVSNFGITIKYSTSAGFEPARAKPNRFQVYLLNHSDTMSHHYNTYTYLFFK